MTRQGEVRAGWVGRVRSRQIGWGSHEISSGAVKRRREQSPGQEPPGMMGVTGGCEGQAGGAVKVELEALNCACTPLELLIRASARFVLTGEKTRAPRMTEKPTVAPGGRDLG